MSEEKKKQTVVLHTFAKTWEFEYVIYGFGDFTLPFPLSLTAAGMFIAVFIVIQIIFAVIPFLHGVSPLYRFAVLPIGITYALRKLDIDGKPPYTWLYKQGLYFLQPKALNKFRKETKYDSFSWNRMNPVVVKEGRKRKRHGK